MQSANPWKLCHASNYAVRSENSKKNNNGKLIDLLTCSSDQNHELQCIPKITKNKTTKFGHTPPPYPRAFSFVLPQKGMYQPINTKKYP